MSRISQLKLFLLGSLACLGLIACSTEIDEDPQDPAGDLGDEEWHDEGPLPEDVSSDVEPLDELAAPPRFQLPFPCNQVWAGQTRTGHSPQNAVDFNRSNDEGDVVVAAAAGTVTRVENEGNTSYGRWIEIGHGGGHRTRYAHLSAQAVSKGQRVKRGQRIGRVGSTGGSSGPHLHYEQRHNGAAVRASFNGNRAFYFGTRNYRSRNCN
jgi:murein DD-endopeptidase MepM/ murein hydrolase activator NlpD